MLRGYSKQVTTSSAEQQDSVLPSVFKKPGRFRDMSEDHYKQEAKRQVGSSIKPSYSQARGPSPPTGPVKRETFTFLMAVGRGSYGKVWKAVHRKSGAVYAVKEMSRSQ